MVQDCSSGFSNEESEELKDQPKKMNALAGTSFMTILSVFIVVFILSFYLTNWSKRIAHHWGIVDRPNVRSSHNDPTPRLGGIAIILSFLTCLAVLQAVPGSVSPLPSFNGIIAGALIVGAFSLLDDAIFQNSHHSYIISIVWKLAGQILAIAATLLFGTQLGGFRSLLEPAGLGTAGQVLNILWILWMTNVYNFMDGIDGLAGLTAVIYAIFLGFLAMAHGSQQIAMICWILAASSLGFVCHNFPSAKVFMGDSGSTFLGFFFGTISLVLPQSNLYGNALFPCLIFFGVFVYDASFTLLRRLFRGKNIFKAHKGHLYQRLIACGLTHRSVTLTYSIFSVLLGSISLIYMRASETSRIALSLLVLFLLFAGTLAVYILERRANQMESSLDSVRSRKPAGGSGDI